MAIVVAVIHFWPNIKGLFSKKTQAQVSHVIGTVKSDYKSASNTASKISKAISTPPPTASTSSTSLPSPAYSSGVSICAEPTCGYHQVVQAILGARQVDLVMYELNSPSVEGALIAAHKAGANVRVFLDRAYHGYSVNSSSAAFLQAHGVAVRFAPASVILHEKAVILNNNAVYLMSGNLDHNYYTTSADWLIHDTNPGDVVNLVNAFNADWNGDLASTPVDTGIQGNLLFSPDAETAYLNFINHATKSIDLSSEEMIDPRVVNSLVAAAHRGIDVRVLMQSGNISSATLSTLTTAGVHVRLLDSPTLYIHAKTLIIDGQVAILGSQNDSTASLVYNREASLIITSPRLVTTATNDFNGWWVA